MFENSAGQSVARPPRQATAPGGRAEHSRAVRRDGRPLSQEAAARFAGRELERRPRQADAQGSGCSRRRHPLHVARSGWPYQHADLRADARELRELHGVQDARRRRALVRGDRKPLPGGATLELRRRCHRGKLENVAAGDARGGEWGARPDGALDHVGGSARRREVSPRELLQARRALRRALERGELQEPVLRPGDVPRVLHRWNPRMGHPRAAGSGRGGLLRAGALATAGT